jgi:putative ABC transport system permease protein
VNFVALKMLLGDKVKYLGIVIGLMFASFLITQQLAIFVGLMARTFSTITDVTTTDIWVMDPTVKNIDDFRPINDQELYRVRAVPGVAWAVPFFKSTARIKLATGYQTCTVLGLDDQSLTGGPIELMPGVTMADLRQSNAVILDAPNAHEKLHVNVGDEVELNDNRVRIVGLCDITQNFQAFPTLYTTYSRARVWVPGERNTLPFILVKAETGQNAEQVCGAITAQTGLAAYTNRQFKEKTLWYYIKSTGIPINFGTTVILGFVVGIAIAGQLFYQFTVDNLKHFGTLKAMGATNGMLVRMILLQTSLAGLVGYGLGLGVTVGFKVIMGTFMPKTQQVMLLAGELFLITGVAIAFIIVVSSLFALIKVVRLEPAIVFK